MNRLEQAIAYTFPGWALRRERSRHALNALYDGGRSGSRHRAQRNTDTGDADYAVQMAGREMVQQARELEQNYDVVKGALDTFEARLVGQQIQTEPMVKSKDGSLHTQFNAELKKWYLRWLKSADISGSLGGGAMQRMAVRSWIRDGEFLARQLEGKAYPHLSPVPLSLEFMECDQLAYEDGEYQGRRIIQGVEKGVFNRSVAYHLYKEHPGARRMHGRETLRIPSESVLHPTLVERFGQTRGITGFHATFKRLDDVRDYDDSERVAAKMAAALGAQIIKDPSALDAPLGQYPDAGARKFAFRPAMFFDNLNPGEEIKMVNPNGRPNAQLDNFRRGQLRMMARGIGMSHSTLTGEFAGTYSSERQAESVNHMGFTIIADDFVWQFWQPVYQRVIETVILYELEKVPPGIDRWTLFDAEHRHPSMAHIDPYREERAKELKIKNRTDSRKNLVRQGGRNPDDVDVEIKSDAFYAQGEKDDHAGSRSTTS